MKNVIDKLRYPIGKFETPAVIDKQQINEWIDELAAFPLKLRQAVQGLSDKQLDTPYRQGGWTIRQVVHHIPDSHMNAYVRVKLAFTEDHPTIRPYHEDLWAECAEAKSGPIEMSLLLLEALHARWVAFFRTLNVADFERSYNHPESGDSKLSKVLGMYVWHGNHHLNHVLNVRKINKW